MEQLNTPNSILEECDAETAARYPEMSIEVARDALEAAKLEQNQSLVEMIQAIINRVAGNSQLYREDTDQIRGL